MYKKLTWGLSVLIVICIGFIFYVQYEFVQFKKGLEADRENPKTGDVETEKQKEPQHIAIGEAPHPPPRAAQEGYMWEWHGDHWHEMPIAQGDQTPIGPHGQMTGSTETEKVETPSVPYKGPLTYHEELLKTNPVKALRAQAEERGHWSAKWIPPFPPDDLEAAEIARTEYLLTYYQTIGDTNNQVYQKALSAASEQSKRRMKALMEAYGPRVADLMTLIWQRYPEEDVPPLYENGWRKSPSNYFPLSIEDLKFPLQISDSK